MTRLRQRMLDDLHQLYSGTGADIVMESITHDRVTENELDAKG